jgi:hypothetical protein
MFDFDTVILCPVGDYGNGPGPELPPDVEDLLLSWVGFNIEIRD